MTLGYSEEWIERRMQSIAIRTQLTGGMDSSHEKRKLSCLSSRAKMNTYFFVAPYFVFYFFIPHFFVDICVMYYRRKIILALLQSFEGELEKIRLQKLLFLLTKRQEKAEYDFVPYKYGCFSYSANADLTAMVNKGMLSETDSYFKIAEPVDYIQQLRPQDRQLLGTIRRLYGDMNASALMKHTYVNFPYWAINSLKAEALLSKTEFENVQSSRPKSDRIVLFSIGYEGISLEEYLNRLLRNDVKLLVDVRNNPLSMKYGFSKTQLQRFCEGLGIAYMHFPDVGIQSEQRQELHSQRDYDQLFAKYRQTTLKETISTQQTILALLKKHQRIALTCFEANICQCHRKHLAESITQLPDFTYEVKHI